MWAPGVRGPGSWSSVAQSLESFPCPICPLMPALLKAHWRGGWGLRSASPQQVWRQMLSLGLQPSQHGYNLLLGAARDCGLGDPAVASAVLLRPREETALLQPPAGGRKTRRRAQVGADRSLSAKLHVEALERQLFLEASQALEGPSEPQEARAPGQAQSGMETKAEHDHTVALTSVAPELPPWGLEANLLTPGAAPLAVVSFGTVSTPADRLALMGGLEGFLGKMAEHGLRPDIKTLTLLAEVVEPGSPAESSLLSVLDMHGVETDLTFFNTLMRKKSKRGDLEGAKVRGSGEEAQAPSSPSSRDSLLQAYRFIPARGGQTAQSPVQAWAWVTTGNGVVDQPYPPPPWGAPSDGADCKQALAPMQHTGTCGLRGWWFLSVPTPTNLSDIVHCHTHFA